MGSVQMESCPANFRGKDDCKGWNYSLAIEASFILVDMNAYDALFLTPRFTPGKVVCPLHIQLSRHSLHLSGFVE